MKTKIILYNDKYSYYGSLVKKWLSDSGLIFDEKNVEDVKVAAELFEVSGQHAIPVVVAGEEVILGFSEEKLKKLL